MGEPGQILKNGNKARWIIIITVGTREKGDVSLNVSRNLY